jgi:hypothetical protein
LSAPILRRTIAARIRTAGVHRERITTTIRAVKTRDPAWRFDGGDALNISEAIGNIYPSSNLSFR